MNTKDNLAKFSNKIDGEIFVGYSTPSRGYRIYNKRTLKIEETSSVILNKNDSNKTQINQDLGNKEVDIDFDKLNLRSNNLVGARNYL